MYQLSLLRRGVRHVAQKKRSDHRISVGLPAELFEDLQRLAEAGKWDISKQVRYELLYLRGWAGNPQLPQQPNHEGHPRRFKKAANS